MPEEPYVLPPFREKRASSGPGAKTWAAVGTLLLLMMLAARACMNETHEAPPIFVRVADVGPSVYSPGPAPAPERPSADRMQVMPMALPQPVAAPVPAPAAAPFKTTEHIEGTRREVVAFIPVLDLGVQLGAEQGFRGSYFWASVKLDGVELPGFPRKVSESFQLNVPLTDRKLFRVIVTLRHSDRSLSTGQRYDVSPGKVDSWSFFPKNVRADARPASLTTSIQDPLKRPFESHAQETESNGFR